VGRCNYNKKVGVIYNPNSGKKRDVRGEIIKVLASKDIDYQLLESSGYMHAWRIA
jgi:diacylglycerol kinase family enzyme